LLLHDFKYRVVSKTNCTKAMEISSVKHGVK
jgi:hypothetical protein